MKRLFLAALVAATMIPAAPAKADTYCMRLRVTILGEHWFAKDVCVPCPTPDGDCPRPEPPSTAEGSYGDPSLARLDIRR